MVKRRMSLAECVELVGGGTPKSSETSYWNGDIPWLSVADFGGKGRYVSGAEKAITLQGLEESSATLLDSGDCIISARGTVGEVAQLTRPMAFNQSCYGVRAIGELVDANYLYYLLLASIEDLKSKAHGSVFATITRKTFSDVTVELPSRHEQVNIARVLGSLDDKLAMNAKIQKSVIHLGELLYKESVLESSVRAKVDNVAYFHNKKRVPLSALERAAVRGNVPYYGAAGVLDYVNEPLFNEVLVLVGEDGSVVNSAGNPVTQYIWGPAWVNNHAHVLTGNDISTDLLYFALRSSDVTNLVTGAVQPKISMKNLKTHELVLPDGENIRVLEGELGKFMSLYKSLQEENAHLAVLRDTLLAALMDGALIFCAAEGSVSDAV